MRVLEDGSGPSSNIYKFYFIFFALLLVMCAGLYAQQTSRNRGRYVYLSPKRGCKIPFINYPIPSEKTIALPGEKKFRAIKQRNNFHKKWNLFD